MDICMQPIFSFSITCACVTQNSKGSPSLSRRLERERCEKATASKDNKFANHKGLKYEYEYEYEREKGEMKSDMKGWIRGK